MSDRPNIILLGFMGTGKTTVGRLLAERLGMSLVDMDVVIEERAGKPISSIFAEEGEAHFRDLERQLVQELSKDVGQVVAAGGGVVLNPANVADLGETGMPVCLLASPEMVLRRVEAETHRPLLEGGDKANKILALLEARKELYESVPQCVDTTHLLPEDVATRIVELYEARSN